MLAELEAHPDWGMAHAALRATKDGEVYFRAFEGTHAHLLVANHVDLNVLVARRDLVQQVGGFDETLRRGVDYDLVLKMAAVTGLHLVRHVGVDYTDDSDAAGSGPRISTHESPAWLSVIASRHLVDWDAVRTAERPPGHTTLVLTGQGSVRALTDWLHAVAGAASSGAALDAVVVGVRLPRWQHVVLAVLADALGHATLVTIQADRGAAVRANVGLAAARGERVVLVLDPVQPDADAVLRLAGHLDDSPGIAQPVTLTPSGEVLTAGAVFDPDTALPQPFLAGHAVDDAGRAGRLSLPAADGPVVALRAADLAGLDGLDPLAGPFAVADLALRAAQDGGPATVLQPDVRLVARTQEPDPAEVVAALRVLAARHPVAPEGSEAAWRAAGFDVTGHRYDLVPGQPTGPTDHPVLRPRTLVTPTPVPPRAVPGGGLEVTESAPALRWAIDLASPVGAPGRAWGDTHYGEALAAALRRRGQHVVVDARDTRHRPSRDHDDVVLVLRGLDLVRPRPGRVNLEWIISHPDLVTPEEVAGFDRVFAASHGWSEQVSTRVGRRRPAAAAGHRPVAVPPPPGGVRHRRRRALRGQLPRDLPQLAAARDVRRDRRHRARRGLDGDAAAGRRRLAAGRQRRPRRALHRRRAGAQRPLGGHAAHRLRLQPAHGRRRQRGPRRQRRDPRPRPQRGVRRARADLARRARPRPDRPRPRHALPPGRGPRACRRGRRRPALVRRPRRRAARRGRAAGAGAGVPATRLSHRPAAAVPPSRRRPGLQAVQPVPRLAERARRPGRPELPALRVAQAPESLHILGFSARLSPAGRAQASRCGRQRKNVRLGRYQGVAVSTS